MRAGVVYGPMEHHLDHLAPLCSLLNIPLIVTDEEIARQARAYYPDLELIYWDYLEAAANTVASFDTLFCALPRPLFDDAFLLAQLLAKKRVRTIWVPHGNSDKNHAPNMKEVLQFDDEILVYGPKMADFFQLNRFSAVGNFRLQYYLRHKRFYQNLLPALIPQGKKIALYAPTWNDADASSSLEHALPHLLQTIPDGWHLVVKPHPNQTSPPIDHPQATLLTQFPPIYPLLEASSIYVGDMSSIGYDFLAFRRPMFFLNVNRRDPSLFLFRCGTLIDPSDFPRIFEIITTTPRSFAGIQKEVYDYTFGVSNGLTCV